ncbi:MAG: SRPBCC domain-containing protein [Cyanophyceae cyanobacterium]
MKISIETTVNASIERVWEAWITPEVIKRWNFASDDWCCPDASQDFSVGGKFNYRMEAKDGSLGFNFEGRFTSINEPYSIEFALDDHRKVSVTFSETVRGVRVLETFEAEDEFSAEQQRQGWQSILNNFRIYVEV